MKRRFFEGFVFLAAVLGSTAAAGSLFPFYDNVQTEQGSFFAVRPFYSHIVVEEGQIRDYFWPLYSRKEFKDEQSSRALIFWYTHKFDAKDATPRDRNWLLPVYFHGRDVNGKGYFALFPLGGTINEFLGRDEIMFALFPVYGKSRINDVKTTSVFWPIYSRTRGTGIERDRVFPIYGKSVLEGKYEKHFMLWPFWTSAEYFYPGNSGKSWLLFPVCGRSEMERERTLWVIPPFFRFTKGEKQDRLFCPWPFIQKIDSAPRSKFYVWPLWGEDRYAAGPTRRTFLLWPLLWSEKKGDKNLLKTSRMALPFFYQDYTVRREKDASPEKQTEISNYWKIWPLMSWQREGETSRFRMLELWPLKNSAPVERNWTPLWTLYKRTNTDGVIRKDVLWFAWHSEQDPAVDHKEWSLLKGLLAYKRDGEKQNVRLFYFVRFGEEK
ncbi:MAG: hypothetical protein WC334_03390 [Kiritimatiellales bacterium]|jgi:hypothetical protein